MGEASLLLLHSPLVGDKPLEVVVLVGKDLVGGKSLVPLGVAPHIVVVGRHMPGVLLEEVHIIIAFPC